MSPLLTWIFSILAAVMLFLHGLAAFSEEMARLGGERLRDALRRLTRTDWRGALVGAVATAVVQSSSAVTSMAVGLSHNRTLTERGAFAVMIGANVGTTPGLPHSDIIEARCREAACAGRRPKQRLYAADASWFCALVVAPSESD